MGQSHPKSVSPPHMAREAVRRLRDLADPDKAARGLAFFKRGESVVLYGVSAPEIRELVREIHAQTRTRWSVADAVAFCEIMASRQQVEAKSLGVLLLGRYHREFPRSLLGKVRRWVRSGWFASWAEIDGLCPAVITPLVRSYPATVTSVIAWSESPNQWLRRASVVTLVPLARRGQHLAESYALVKSLQDDREDLMHKACGWLLREAGKTDRRRLERFLLRYGPSLPRTTVRYAIERIPEPRRSELLVATRAV